MGNYFAIFPKENHGNIEFTDIKGKDAVEGHDHIRSERLFLNCPELVI